jgi:molybdate transport system substrate-binding protein
VQIKILSGGAVKGLVDALAGAFTARCSATIDGTYGAVGAMRDLLQAGAPADLLLLTRAMIDALAAAGEVEDASIVDIGAVATAVAVRSSDRRPDVSDAASLQRALLEAGEIFFPDPARATAGIHVARVLAALGVDRDVAAKVRTHPNGATAMRALADATTSQPIGITQASEILSTPGVALVASLPAPHGLSTIYTAGVTRRALQPDLARQFVDLLSAPASARQRKAAGFDA